MTNVIESMDNVIFSKHLGLNNKKEKTGKLILLESSPNLRKAPTEVSAFSSAKDALEYGEGVDSIYKYVNEPEKIEIFLD